MTAMQASENFQALPIVDAPKKGTNHASARL
jgi:hypothetical protein